MRLKERENYGTISIWKMKRITDIKLTFMFMRFYLII